MAVSKPIDAQGMGVAVAFYDRSKVESLYLEARVGYEEAHASPLSRPKPAMKPTYHFGVGMRNHEGAWGFGIGVLVGAADIRTSYTDPHPRFDLGFSVWWAHTPSSWMIGITAFPVRLNAQGADTPIDTGVIALNLGVAF